ncbi:MAG: hypothetical protein IJS99_08745 [Synergistaceae bacterium]|nr:hypothetical protein [Synergistaceae bacterium]
MTLFIKKVAVAVLIFALSIASVFIIMTLTGANITKLAGEVFYVINKAEKNSGCPVVYLGDSVCNQIWPQKEYNEKICYLSSNMAITTAGTYLLLKNYLEHNPQTKEAYYIIAPENLANDLNLNYTYTYFIIPFLDDNNINLLTQETKDMLDYKFGRFFVENKFIKGILRNNNLFMKIYLSHVQRKTEKKYTHRLSRTAIIYLEKIRELCKKYDVKFLVRPIPTADIEKNYGWEDLQQDINNYNLNDLFGDFMQRINYYPKDWYLDNMHFKPEILKQHRDEIRASIMP